MHFLFGVPPKWMMGQNGRPRWHLSFVSVALTLLQWYSYGSEIYVAQTYWRSDWVPGQPVMPLEAFVVLCALNLSETVTFTLFVVYFYWPSHNFIHDGSERVFPLFEFSPRGAPEVVAITRRQWRKTNAYVIVGFIGVVLFYLNAFESDMFLDFKGLHDFVPEVSRTIRVVYFIGVVNIYWGFFSTVVACCTFYVICQDMINHIEYTTDLIINNARDFTTAKRFHESLLDYIDHVVQSIKCWFVVHVGFFMLITLSVAVEWILAFSKKTNDHLFDLILSQLAGSLMIACKFAFPFIVASHVTRSFENMYKRFNREINPGDFPELDVFMSYCSRCRAGFSVLGVRVTWELAVISLLSCFVGFFKLFKRIA